MNFADIKALKNKQRITATTCYDYTTALLLDQLDLDVVLVGDSLAMVMLGHEDTKSLSLDDMFPYAKSVNKGINNGLVVFDMPIGTYDTPDEAYENVQKIKIKTGIEVVKVEGRPDVVNFLVGKGVQVMGHTGLKPQTAEKYGVVGKNEIVSNEILNEAREIADAGAFSIILECVPSDLAEQITDELSIPTIGIGAGIHCDGQILVLHDLVGLYDGINPKFLRKYANLGYNLQNALRNYIFDVRQGGFPSKDESYN